MVMEITETFISLIAVPLKKLFMQEVLFKLQLPLKKVYQISQ